MPLAHAYMDLDVFLLKRSRNVDLMLNWTLKNLDFEIFLKNGLWRFFLNFHFYSNILINIYFSQWLRHFWWHQDSRFYMIRRLYYLCCGIMIQVPPWVSCGGDIPSRKCVEWVKVSDIFANVICGWSQTTTSKNNNETRQKREKTPQTTVTHK